MAKTMKFTGDDLQKGLARKIFKWVDTVLKDELPADIYASAHAANYDDRQRAMGWLRERGYRIVGQGEGVHQIYRGTALIRQTTMTLNLDNPDDLLSVMEVSKENVNIPPPPWNPKHE